MKNVLPLFKIFGIVLLVFLLGWGAQVILTPAKTATDIITKTLDADNVIYNYEFFKQQHQDWLAINRKIEEAQASADRYREMMGEDRSQWTFEDKNEISRLNSILDGLKYQRDDIASKYNARSKMLNRKLFKTDELPYEL